MVHPVTPIIPLVSEFDTKELLYLKHSKKTVHAVGDEEYTKVRVPIINSGASVQGAAFLLSMTFL
jgi:hypothetical protein